MKDLVDLVLLTEAGLLPDPRLAERLRHVHAVRDGAPPPATIPEPPAAWSVEYARLAGDLGLATAEVDQAMALVRNGHPEARIR